MWGKIATVTGAVLSLILAFAFGGVYATKLADDKIHNSIYQMSLTEVRACTLSLDSEIMRYVIDPLGNHYSEIFNRYELCGEIWSLAYSYLPEHAPEEIERSLRFARWEYEQWNNQITYMLSLHLSLMKLIGTDRSKEQERVYKIFRKELGESRKYRDRIEAKLMEAW
jgi:hypothetical protein